MKDERVQEIMERLEQTPTEPLMMLVDHEAQEVFRMFSESIRTHIWS